MTYRRSRPNSQTPNWNDVSLMKVCRLCGGLSGELFSEGLWLHQKCRCERTGDERWPGHDFNEAVCLCAACGLAPLASGLKWSVWFCEPCKKTICALNDACQTYVIPIGRHSFMGCRWQGELIVCQDQPDAVAFGNALTGMFSRIELVKSHSVETVDANCNDANIEGPNPRVSAYLDALRSDELLRSRRLRQLLDRFQVPESILCRIASEHSN